MKKICLLILFAFINMLCFSQSDHDEVLSDGPVNFVLTKAATLTICKNAKGDLTEETYEMPRGTIFFYVGALEDKGYLLQPWASGGKSDIGWVYRSEHEKAKGQRITYFISTNDFNEKCQRRYGWTFISLKNGVKWFAGTSLTVGATIIPFKIRPSIALEGKRTGFDFSKDIQLGLSGGLKHRLSRYKPIYLNTLVNVGISSVSMDAYSTRNKLSESIDVAAFTYSCATILEFRNVQFGAFLGWDRVSDKNRNNWIYQGRPWWSIGFGYSIFSSNTGSEKTDEK